MCLYADAECVPVFDEPEDVLTLLLASRCVYISIHSSSMCLKDSVFFSVKQRLRMVYLEIFLSTFYLKLNEMYIFIVPDNNKKIARSEYPVVSN